MNCAECRDNLAALAEALLDCNESLQCRAHLETCADCRAEYEAITRLQQRLTARGEAAAAVRIVEPVMRRIHREEYKPERENIMSRLLKYRWGFGLGAAACAAVILSVILLTTPRAEARAVEALAKGAQAAAKLNSIHLRCQLRTVPFDNFAAIMPDQGFVNIELWKQFTPELKWRVEKPGRVALMDGKSTLLFDRHANFAMRLDQPSASAFDTEWLHKMADLSQTLNDELQAIQAHGWPVTVTTESQGGRAKTVVTVEAKSNLPEDDYLKNKFFETTDTRRVYVFDEESELLESVNVTMHGSAGDVSVLEINQIDYNTLIDASVFSIELPADVSWMQKQQSTPGDEKYSNMTAEQSARTFFEACGRGDWNEAGKFTMFPLTDPIKQYLDGLELVSLGTPFGSAVNQDQFVPYNIKFKNGDVKKFNLALRKDEQTGRWLVDGGL